TGEGGRGKEAGTGGVQGRGCGTVTTGGREEPGRRWAAGLAWGVWGLAMVSLGVIWWLDRLFGGGGGGGGPGAARGGGGGAGAGGGERGHGRGGAGQPAAAAPGGVAAAGLGPGQEA